MLQYQMILCGRGGQGIVFLTRLLGEIATANGFQAISSETHGMAVRGGSINSHLKVGPFLSPLVRRGHADVLISLDPEETANNRHFLSATGLIVENSPLQDENGIRRIDASPLARSLGRTQLENVVVLGFVSSLPGFPFSAGSIREKLNQDPRNQIRTMNIAALDAGIAAAHRKSKGT